MFVFVNQSSKVSNSDVALIARACATQIKYHAAPAWGRQPIGVGFAVGNPTLPTGTTPIFIIDEPDVDGALGYHDEGSGEYTYGKVFVNPVLDNGGGVLSGPGFSVSSVLSHEVLEAFGDLNVNLWADSGNGYAVALELCDPVESDSYFIKTQGHNVMVSNFVTPHWFDQNSNQTDNFDYMNRLLRPFMMTSGGYWIQLAEGKVTQQFGDSFPEWKKPYKLRAARRVSSNIVGR